MPTVLVPLHLLHADREYFEWPMGSLDDGPPVAAEILAEIDAYALPFFREYDNVDSLRRALAKPNPPWFVLTPEQRIATLAAIEHASGSSEDAIQRLDRALAERVDSLPKKRWQLEKLRAHLAAVGGATDRSRQT
jgi:hypothetical protein